MIRFYLDTCIIIDILSFRAEGFKKGMTILDYCVNGKIKLCTSVLSFSNISYILKNEISSENLVNQFNDLLEIIDITFEDKNVLIDAIEKFKLGKIKDFEDSIQYSSAILNSCDYIVTRDKQFLKYSDKIISTSDAIKLIKKEV